VLSLVRSPFQLPLGS
ncbi:bacterial Ig-like domain family protein, partial [Vibrio parahaemolyticus V-223/04]